MKHIVIFLCLATLFGCQTTADEAQVTQQNLIPAVDTLFNDGLFTKQSVISEQDIFALPAQAQSQFLTFYEKQLSESIRPDTIIANYLDSSLSGFAYDGATLTATESFNRKGGNCISLAILTQAYASLVGIDTTFRKVASQPVYKKVGNTVLVSNHFMTKLFAPKIEPEKEWISIIRAGTVIDYYPTQDIVFVGSATYDDLIAKYYANIATKQLLDSHFDASYSNLLKALEHAPQDPELINLAAILHRRMGDMASAKKLFSFALEYNLLSSNLITSYASLAQHMGDNHLVKVLEKQLETVAKTPFDFLMVAQNYSSKGRYRVAKNLLNNIVKHYSYLPEPYFELAKIHYQQGDMGKAQVHLQLAVEMSTDLIKKARFKDKLKSLELVTKNDR